MYLYRVKELVQVQMTIKKKIKTQEIKLHIRSYNNTCIKNSVFYYLKSYNN